MRLPFQPRRKKGDWAAWIYQHRVGLLVTVVIYLSLTILFVSYKIVILPKPVPSIEIEIAPAEIEKIQELIEQRKIEQMQQSDLSPVKNRISDDNSKLDETLRDDKSTAADDIYKDAERLQNELLQGQEDYDKNLIEIEQAQRPDFIEPKSNVKAKQGNRDQDAFVKGNVAASFSLAGRTADYIDKPAYKCEGGGQVVVNISVNRNGKVVSASVDRATSTSDKCILDEAVASARASRFNASATAPNPQRGTLTYTFMPQ